MPMTSLPRPRSAASGIGCIHVCDGEHTMSTSPLRRRSPTSGPPSPYGAGFRCAQWPGGVLPRQVPPSVTQASRTPGS